MPEHPRQRPSLEDALGALGACREAMEWIVSQRGPRTATSIWERLTTKARRDTGGREDAWLDWLLWNSAAGAGRGAFRFPDEWEWYADIPLDSVRSAIVAALIDERWEPTEREPFLGDDLSARRRHRRVQPWLTEAEQRVARARFLREYREAMAERARG